MAIDLEKSNREEIIVYLRRKGEKGISQKRREELLKMAKKIMRKESAKKHRGGNHPVAYNTDMPVGYSFSDAWGEAAPVALDAKTVAQDAPHFSEMAGGKKRRNKRSKQTGGEETEGATFLPTRFFNPTAPLPESKTDFQTAYGIANPASGACVNLAPFPGSSGQMTGGSKGKSKKTAPKKSEKKSEKKPKEKKEESLWDKITGMF